MIGNIGDVEVIESSNVKLFGMMIDSSLNFDYHINIICKKVARKLSAILSLNRRKMLMQAFIISQFSYCPLAWMLHSRKANTKINNLHYRTLCIVYRDEISTFEQLLEKDGSLTIHQQNIQCLAITMFKVSPSFMADIFSVNVNLNTENVCEYKIKVYILQQI